jgi:hypothetical protein
VKVGDKLKAQWSESYTDHTTQDKIYEVIEVKKIGFFIINDKGERCFPISTTFIRVNE